MQRLVCSLAVSVLLLLAVPASHASIFTFRAILDGASESPPVATPGTGLAIITLDTVIGALGIHAEFSGLIGTTTAAHIHCCVSPGGVVGVATTTPFFVGFPIGVTSGIFDTILDLTDAGTYSSGFIGLHGSVAGAEAALTAGLLAGEAYFNIHTVFRPGGEIRGFLAVPEPLTWLLMAGGLVVFGAHRRRQF